MSEGCPRVAAYLAGLPAGLDSYPAHQQKASVPREFLRGLPLASVGDRVPSALRPLVSNLPPVSQWLPEVHVNVIYLAVQDALFTDDEAFVRWAYKQNTRLLSSPLYSVLFKLASPERVLRGAASRWGQFHRGIEAVVETIGAHDAALELRAAPGLLPALLASCYGTAFRAALEAAGARHVDVTLTELESGNFGFRATWT